MSAIESSGDIEVHCHPAGSAIRSTAPYFGTIAPGDRLALLFTPGDATDPPYALKIVSPTGATILDTIVRDLPTSTPQSPSPIEFVVSTRGIYRIEIREMKGRQRGEGRLTVP